MPLSQIHYHFGSKQGLVLALFEYLNAQLLDRQNALFGDPSLKLSEQWDRACDYLDEDIASGYVRVLQELIAASWYDAEVAKVIRAGIMGWVDLIVGVAKAGRDRRSARSAPSPPRRSARSPPPLHRRRKACTCSAWRRRACRCAQALRRVGDLIRIAEAINQTRGDACAQNCRTATDWLRRDGVNLAYEVYGDGADTMVFMPPWSIVHSRIYKAQLPYFSERFRCITYDGAATANPTGRRMSPPTRWTTISPTRSPSWMRLDAGQAILVGLSFGGLLACVLAAHHPERVKAAILAGTVASIGPAHTQGRRTHFTAARDRSKAGTSSTATTG